MEPQLRHVLAFDPNGVRRVAYWYRSGRGDRPPVICVHGLTRNGRDFDWLATDLARDRPVACPDVAGRGRSDRLADPAQYGYPRYMADTALLLARLDAERIDWVGTSMGGFLGMLLAALRDTPIRRLVLNDVGPFIPKAALEHIATYVGKDPAFADLGEAERYQRLVAAGFGSRLPDAVWSHYARHMTRPDPAGGLRLAYDPEIARPFRDQPIADVDLWAVWDRIRCPVLVLRGAESGLLLPETAAEMAVRGPRATVVTVADAAHAPALADPDQIARIRDFLDR